jgi:hypothetical protein
MKPLTVLTYLFLAGMLGLAGCSKDLQEDLDEEQPLTERKFYYAYDKKIFLDEVENKFVIAYHPAGLSGIENALSNDFKIKDAEWQYFNNICIVTVDASQRSTFRKKFLKQKDVRSVHPLYAVDDCEMALTDEFVVKYNAGAAQREIDKLSETYRVSVKKVTELHQLLSVPADVDALEVANAYQESGLVEFSQPNFYAKIVFGFNSVTEQTNR